MFTYKFIIKVNKGVNLKWLIRSTKEIDSTCFNDGLVVLYPRMACIEEGSVISMCKEINNTCFKKIEGQILRF